MYSGWAKHEFKYFKAPTCWAMVAFTIIFVNQFPICINDIEFGINNFTLSEIMKFKLLISVAVSLGALPEEKWYLLPIQNRVHPWKSIQKLVHRRFRYEQALTSVPRNKFLQSARLWQVSHPWRMSKHDKDTRSYWFFLKPRYKVLNHGDGTSYETLWPFPHRRV